jgi:Ser/Thr protein kinase RdoA (MazF antagonist)
VLALASTVLDDFEKRALPAFIDFGDMLRAPLVVDVAVAAAYLRVFEDDALQFILPFIAGYHSVSNLDAMEFELLFDLIRARLVTTVSMLYWRLSARSEDDGYRQSTLRQESGAGIFLARLEDVGRSRFNQSLRDAM